MHAKYPRAFVCRGDFVSIFGKNCCGRSEFYLLTKKPPVRFPSTFEGLMSAHPQKLWGRGGGQA